MKIGEIIREKRKELSFTQEQLADFLGVTAPAVHKWEKGTTYPDITTLPALARVLQTDLNPLLSFQDDLTDEEIARFSSHLEHTLKEGGYEIACSISWVTRTHRKPVAQPAQIECCE